MDSFSSGDSDAALATLFDGSVVVRQSGPAQVAEQLYPSEWQRVQACVSQRQAEYGMARLLAREALAELRFQSRPLLSGAGGEPLWPPGAVGSISHTRDRCIVVVSGDCTIASLGVDVERRQVLEPDVLALIFTARERVWLDACSPAERATQALARFSAKEALFKCQYPHTRCFLDFKQVELLAGDEPCLLRPRLTDCNCSGGRSLLRELMPRLRVRYRESEQHVICGAVCES